MVAIYSRQSLDKKDSISTDMQVEYCKKEFDCNSEKYRVFVDKGFSGKNIERPAFQELLECVHNGEVNKVIVYRLDRISRSITDFANIMDIFEEHQVSFVSSTEKFDTSTPMGRAMLYIIMVFAQLERETIAERIKDNYYSRGKGGVFLGGPPPMGFTNVSSTKNGKKIKILKPTEDIEIIKDLFRIYADSNRSLGDIAREFKKKYGNQYGVWNNIKLSRMLHNPVYVKADADVYNFYNSKKCIMVNDIREYTGEKACFIFGKRDRSKNKYTNIDHHVVALSQHKGVVDSDTFLRCQYKLDGNKQLKNNGKGKHTWLTGLMKCGYCGYSLTVKQTRGGTKYLYCTGKIMNSCDTGIQTLALTDLEDAVDTSIQQELKKIGESLPVKAANTEKDNELKIELFQINDQINRLIDSISEGNDTLIEYINRRILTLDMQKKEIEKQLQKSTLSTKKVELPTLDDWIGADKERKKEFAARLISKIMVKDDGISIIWKY